MARILVIEDEELIGENIQQILAFEGHEVTHVLNGLEGVLYAQKHLPDLILSDVMMPVLDGYKVLEHIRLILKTALIPLVFITAQISQEDLMKAKMMEVNGYIRKPFSSEELLSVVSEVLRQ
jgi:CheY-like chemotaxis protein